MVNLFQCIQSLSFRRSDLDKSTDLDKILLNNKMKYLLTILVFTLLIIIILNRENKLLTEIKKRYNILMNAIQFHEKYSDLYHKRSIITGLKRKEDTIAYNINKGYEIYIAIDNESDINSAMYVLLHEIAHTTVPEYDHSPNFWQNFKELRQIASDANLYVPVKNSKYCGQNITDSLTAQ